jgi:hypothetical protein
VTVEDAKRFTALNQLADAMRLRWRKEGEWLQFRDAGFYHARLTEVPNRLLHRWAASRREHGGLTLEDLLEIAQLPEPQLESQAMAEGARLCFGLQEWRFARDGFLRPHWRYLAGFSAEQHQAAQSPAGLPLARMSLTQQQGFLSLALGAHANPMPSLEELGGASLRVFYVAPGGYQWKSPAANADAAGGAVVQIDTPPVYERTREAALQAARRLDPNATVAQITPSEFRLMLSYTLGGPSARLTPFVIHADAHNVIARAPEPVNRAR